MTLTKYAIKLIIIMAAFLIFSGWPVCYVIGLIPWPSLASFVWWQAASAWTVAISLISSVSIGLLELGERKSKWF